jgi:hypothetical protein
MTAIQTDRLALYKWESSNDEFTRVQMNDTHESLEFLAAKFNTGAGAPTSSTTADTKAFYWDTTSSILYFRGITVGGVTPTWTQLSQTFATATQIQNTTATAGSGLNLARSNHVHSVETATAVDINAASGVGSGTALALANHTHKIPALYITNAMIADNAAISASKISGAVGTSSAWATAITINLAGDLTGSISFNGGTTPLTLTATVVDDSHTHATQYQPVDADLTALAALATTGMVTRTAANTYVPRTIVVSGTGLTITNADGVSGNPTITIATATLGTANTLVLRDGAGDFTAGTITAALAGNANTATKWAATRTITLSTDATGSVTFDGSANATLAITVTNAAQATKLTTARTISLAGDASGSVSFDGSSATNTISATVATATALRTARTFTFTGDVATTNAGTTDVTASFDGSAAPTFNLKIKNDSHTHNTQHYTETEINSAKLYQYGNTTSGQGVGLPSDAARTTPRVYVQATEPTYPAGQVAVTGDIWFQI